MRVPSRRVLAVVLLGLVGCVSHEATGPSKQPIRVIRVRSLAGNSELPGEQRILARLAARAPISLSATDGLPLIEAWMTSLYPDDPEGIETYTRTRTPALITHSVTYRFGSILRTYVRGTGTYQFDRLITYVSMDCRYPERFSAASWHDAETWQGDWDRQYYYTGEATCRDYEPPPPPPGGCTDDRDLYEDPGSGGGEEQPNPCPGGGGGGSGGDGSGSGSNCTTEWLVIEISYDNGATWQLWWEGWGTVCG